MDTETSRGWTAELRELRTDVRDLYESYAECLDTMELDRWPEYFTEDARYRVISRENFDQGLEHAAMYCDGVAMIKDRVVAIRETTVYEARALRHFVSGVDARPGPDGTILARGNFLVTECIGGHEPTVSMVGRYIDVIEAKTQRFRERSCVFDNARIKTSLIIPI